MGVLRVVNLNGPLDDVLRARLDKISFSPLTSWINT